MPADGGQGCGPSSGEGSGDGWEDKGGDSGLTSDPANPLGPEERPVLESAAPGLPYPEQRIWGAGLVWWASVVSGSLALPGQ